VSQLTLLVRTTPEELGLTGAEVARTFDAAAGVVAEARSSVVAAER
jgi:hypothetical protein